MMTGVVFTMSVTVRVTLHVNGQDGGPWIDRVVLSALRSSNLAPGQFVVQLDNHPGELAPLVPTAVASGALFVLSSGLLWYVVSFDERLRRWGPRA